MNPVHLLPARGILSNLSSFASLSTFPSLPRLPVLERPRGSRQCTSAFFCASKRRKCCGHGTVEKLVFFQPSPSILSSLCQPLQLLKPPHTACVHVLQQARQACKCEAVKEARSSAGSTDPPSSRCKRRPSPSPVSAASPASPAFQVSAGCLKFSCQLVHELQKAS